MNVSITDEATTSFTRLEGREGALVVRSEAIRYRLVCHFRDRGVSTAWIEARPESMLPAPQRQRWIATQKPYLITCQQLNIFDKANRHHYRSPATPAKS
jgi:hypothetical protein